MYLYVYHHLHHNNYCNKYITFLVIVQKVYNVTIADHKEERNGDHL